MADNILFFYGLNKKLGPLLDWGLENNGKKIEVDTECYETNKPGIFAVGDINTYPESNLILSGFHETTLAVQKLLKESIPKKEFLLDTQPQTQLFTNVLASNQIKIKELHDALPQLQCGRCNTPGCMEYAEEMANGAPNNRCLPGGTKTLKKLNQILSRDTKSLDDNLVVQQSISKFYLLMRMYA